MKANVVRALGIMMLFTATLRAQGIVLQSETEDVGDSKKEKGLLYISHDKVRIDMLGSGDTPRRSMIYDSTLEVMFAVDHEEKTYTRLDKEAMEDVAGRMKQAMSQVEAQLANLPPEQRRMVEEMMKRRGGSAVPAQRATRSVRANGQQREIAALSCRGYDVREGNEKVGEIWVTDWQRFGADDTTFAVFQKMSRFFEDLMQSFQQNALFGDPKQSDFLLGLDQVDGVPVLVVRLRDGEIESRTQISPREDIPVQPAVFAVPKYQERKLVPGN